MIKLPLKHPVNFGSETIYELDFQPLKAKHMRNLSKEVNMNDILGLASTLSGQTPRVIDELSSEDALKVVEIINNFFQPSQEITANK